MPDQMQGEGERARGHTRTATRDDGPVEIDPRLVEQAGEGFGAAKLMRLRLGDLVIREIAAARNVPATEAGPRFFGNPVKPARGPGIDNLLPPGRQIVEQRPPVSHERWIE